LGLVAFESVDSLGMGMLIQIILSLHTDF